MQPQRHIVNAQRGAVVARGADRDLELARQERKLGMQSHMLANQLGPDRAGPRSRRAQRPAHWSVVMLRTQLPLVCMPCMPTLASVGHGVGEFLELDPVILNVLPGGEVAVAAIEAPRHMRQHAHLGRRQRAVRDGGAQHVGVQLKIDAIHQPQRLELVLCQFAGQAARDLVAKFRNPFGDQRPVEIVVDVHGV